MNDAVIRFSLDLNRARHQNIVATQRLNTATTLVVTLRVGGVPYSIGEGCSARILIEKPAGTKTVSDCVCDDDKVAYTFTENDLATVGTLVCQIIVTQLVHGVTERLSTPRFEIINNAGIDVSDVVDSDDFAALTNALALADDFDQRITTLEDELADIAETADAASETANEAKTIAQAASTTATAAQTAAAAATTTANAASTAASSAQNTADSALNAANTAATKADTASTSARLAQEDAADAAEAASEAALDAAEAKGTAKTALVKADQALSKAQEALDAIDDIDVQSNFWFGTQDEFDDLVNPSADVFYVIVPDPEPEPSGDYEVVDGVIAGFGESLMTMLTDPSGTLTGCNITSDENHIHGTMTIEGFSMTDGGGMPIFDVTNSAWQTQVYRSGVGSLSIPNDQYSPYRVDLYTSNKLYIDLGSVVVPVENATATLTFDIPKAGGT